MCMTKNDLINDVAAGLMMTLSQEQVDIVKALFIVKMQGYEIHEVSTLPSTEVADNDFILKRFSIDMLAKGLKESSIKAYLDVIKPFLLNTGINFTDVTSQHIIDYLAVKKVAPNAYGKRNSQSYIAGICRGMFIFFGWAYKKHHIREDIMRDVDRIKTKQKKKDRITPEEMEVCRELLKDNREKALFELMISTGMRVGEITKLRIEDIDFVNRKVSIHGEKTENADREGYLSIKARNAIVKYIGSRATGFVFRPLRNVLKDDKPISTGTIEDIAKAIGERAGVHCKTTVHIYRKTFASEKYRQTRNIKTVSILLGHASTTITEKYYLIDDMKDIEYQALYAA